MLLQVIRAVIGFLLVLFIPGYAATWALFPGKKEIDWIERVALSIGLSISLVVLSVFVLNLVFGIKINLQNSLLIILLITLICSAVWYYRRGNGNERCPACGSETITKYDKHHECNSCNKQWTQVK